MCVNVALDGDIKSGGMNPPLEPLDKWISRVLERIRNLRTFQKRNNLTAACSWLITGSLWRHGEVQMRAASCLEVQSVPGSQKRRNQWPKSSKFRSCYCSLRSSPLHTVRPLKSCTDEGRPSTKIQILQGKYWHFDNFLVFDLWRFERFTTFLSIKKY